MRKLKLQLNDLQVSSFEIGAEARRPGTVHGHGPTEYQTCENCVTVHVTYCGDTTCTTGGSGPTLVYTCNDYTCFGDTCPPAKTCYPPE